jgi:hypothetical protein
MKTPTTVSFLIFFFMLQGSLQAFSGNLSIPRNKVMVVKNKLKKTEDSVLKKVIIDGELCYLIGSSTEKDAVDSDQETKEYLSLINRHELIGKMQGQKPAGNIDVQFKGVNDFDYYKEAERAYLLTFIKRKNIILSNVASSGSKDKKKNKFEALSKMRQKLEKLIINGQATLTHHKNLHKIYVMQGDVLKASEIMDQIMELKFNQ